MSLYAKEKLTIESSYYLTTENLTLEQIKKIEEFIPSKGENLGVVNQNVWIKIDIKNSSQQALTRVLQFTFPYMDDISVYKENGVEKYGRTNNYNTHIHSIENNAFKVALKAFENKTVYVKITSSYTIKTFFEDFNEEEYLEDIFSKKGLFYFCYGILFSLIIYNFFIWFSTRKREFLYYVVFHFLLLAGILSWSGFGFEYIWPTFPLLNYYSYGIIVNLIIGFQILYVIYYLDTEQSLPKITFSLKLLSQIVFFFALTSPVVDLTLLYEITATATTLVLLFITIYLAFIKKQILAFYIFASQFLLISANLLLTLSDLQIIEGSFWIDYSYIWGASIEIILMSFALSYKYKELEKQKTIEEQKRVRTEQMLIDKQKLSSIGENFNHLVHQFRQPLSQINSIVCLLSLQFEDKKVTHAMIEKNLYNIEYQTSYLSKTLEYFRNFTSPDESIEEFFLSDFIARVTIMMESVLKRENISFQTNFDKNILLKTNETQLLQIMSVIITNAKDAFMEKEIQNPEIVLKIFEEESLLHITISNNAGAIEPSVIDKIFDPYYSTKKNTEGTGLGLYITKLIVESKLNSTISVGTQGEWTTFTIRMNLLSQ